MMKNCWLLFTPNGVIIFESLAHGRPAGWKENNMKQPVKSTAQAGSEEYDFSHGVRGKYARRYQRGTNVVVLEPDVAKAFPSAVAVNSSLRALAAIIQRPGKTSVGKL